MGGNTSTTTRARRRTGPVRMGALFAALLWTAAVDAQVVSSPVGPVTGRAPVVSLTVSNDSEPQAPPIAGHVLSASADVVDPDGDTITETTYRWLRGTTEIATTASYTTVADDRGETLTVEATATTDPDTTDPASGTGSVQVEIAANTAPVATNVEIEGAADVGAVLTGRYVFADAEGDAEGTSTYQWYVADNASGTLNRTAIALATATTYTVQAGDQGKYLVFEVTPVAASGDPGTGTAASAVTATSVVGSAPVVTNVVIDGVPMAGETLTVTYDYDDADGDLEGDTEFRWCWEDYGCGSGANFTGNTYVQRDVDANWTIYVEVTPKSRTGTPSTGQTVESNRLTTVPRLSATPDTTAQVLTVGQSNYTFSPFRSVAGGTDAYLFEVDDGALPAGLELAADTGVVSGSPTTATDATDVTFRVKDATTGVYFATDSKVSFTVNAVVSATAVTTPQVLSVGQADYSFHPLTNVAGGTGSYTYDVQSGTLPAGLELDETTGEVAGTPTTQQAAADVTFTVRDANGVSSATTSVVGFEVQGTAPVATSVAITGSPNTGETLVGSYHYDDGDEDEEGDSTYQWYRADDASGTTNRAPIDGATATTYTVLAADQGKYLVFEVVPKAKTGATGTETGVAASAVTATTVAGNAPVALNVAIDGTAGVGETLTGTYTYDDADDDAEGGTTFQWYRADDAAGATRTAIAEATSTTYTLVAADEGKFLVFEVTPKSSAGTPDIGLPARAVSEAIAATLTATAVTTPQVLTVTQADYSFHPLIEVEGGKAPYTYELQTGSSLSGGLQLDPLTGEVRGIPNATRGATNVIFRVKDANGTVATTTSTVNYTVNARITANAITTARVLNVGTAASGIEVMGVGGGTKPWTCEVSQGELPEGLQVVATGTTCRVTDTPTQQQPKTAVTFRVRDANNVYATTSSKVDFTVNGTAPVATELAIAGDLTVGSTVTGSYQYADANDDEEGDTLVEWCRWGVEPCTKSGGRLTGTDPLTYTLQDGDVGAGFHLRITPKSATGNPATGTRVLTGQHAHPVTRTTATADTTDQVLVVGQAGYRFSPFTETKDGKAPYTYDIAEGTLPAGLELDADGGEVAGTPTTQQPASAVVFEVTDANGVTATTKSTVRFTVTGRAPVATAVAIAGDTVVGSLLTATYAYDDADGDDEGASTFQWYRADDAAGTNRIAIDGATALTYTVVAADQGKVLLFEVTPVAASGNPDVGEPAGASTVAVLGTAPVATELDIDGGAAVGETLTGSYRYADAEGDAEGGTTFQWYRADDATGTNRTPIGEATATTYTVQAADLGKVLVFEVTPKSTTGSPDTGLPASVAMATAVTGRAPVASNVVVTGTPMTGEVLTIGYTFNDPDGDEEDAAATLFRWYRADDAQGTNETEVGIPGNALRTRTVQAADVGSYLRAGVQPVSVGGSPNTGTTVKSTEWLLVQGAPPVARNLAIDGIPAVGVDLAGTYAYADPEEDPEGTTTFQWYRADDAEGGNATPIVGATSATYTVVAADLGRHLVFEVTPVSTLAPTTGAPVRATTPTAVAGHAPVASNVRVTGTPMTGQLLSADYAFADADGDEEDTSATLFAWYRADDATGANETLLAAPGNGWSTRTVQPGDAGKYLRVGVQPASRSGTPAQGRMTKAADWVLVSSAPPTLASVSINNIKSPVQGQVLTATATGYADPDGDAAAVHLYQWYRGGVAIDGANANTYTLVAADVGALMTVGVVPKSATGTPDTGVEMLSLPTQAVEAPPTARVTQSGTTYSHPNHNFNTWHDANAKTYFLAPSDQASVVSGPTTSTTNGDNGNYTVLTVTAESQAKVTLRAQRVHVGCATYMNYTGNCNYSESRFTVWYVAADNTALAAGTHKADFQLEARQNNATDTPFRILISMEIVSGGPLVAEADDEAQTLTVGETGYSFRPLTASGGVPPYTYEIESGTLPVGLDLTATSGEITGEPTTQQPAGDVVFRVKDADNTTATTRSTVTFKVNAALTATAVTTAQVLTVGQQAYAFTPLTNVGGGEAPYHFVVSEGQLPAGLELGEDDGEVSGTPTAQQPAGDVTFRVQDDNGSYASTTSTVSFTVNGGAPVARQVSITGQAGEGDFVGDVLTGGYVFEDADGDLEGDSTFQWYRADNAAGTEGRTAIANANASTYTVAAADQGRYLVFEVTPKSQGGSPDTGEPAQGVTAATIQGNAPVASGVAITGTARVGETLAGSYQFDDADGDEDASTVQWYRAEDAAGTSRTPIDEETALAYVVTLADADKYLVFEVTPTSRTGDPAIGTPVRAVTATTAIGGHAPVARDVGFTGINMVGQTLTATYEYFDEDGDEEGDTVIQWCWKDVGCGTGWYGPTFTLRPADAGLEIEVRVTPKSKTGTPQTGETVVSAASMTLAALTATANTAAQTLALGQEVYSFSPLTGVGGGMAPYTCAVATTSPTALPAGLTAAWDGDANACVVTGAPTESRAAGNVVFEVEDANGATITSTVNYTVNARIAATAITTMRLIGVNTATGGADVMSVTGGVKPYVCEVHDGHFPVGLAVSSTVKDGYCRVTGTPTVQQPEIPVTFKVKDANGVYASNMSTVKFTIVGSAPVVSELVIEGDRTVGNVVTAKYKYTDSNGDEEGDSLVEWCRWGKEPCTKSARLLTGTDALTYTLQDGDVNAGFHFRVTPKSATGTPDTGTRVTSGQHTHPVSPRITAQADTTAQVLVVGQANYAFTPLAANAGRLPYTYEVADGTLPAGLTLDEVSGEIAGVPTQVYNAADVEFAVKDANGVYATTTSTVRFTVNAVISATAVTTSRTLTTGVAVPDGLVVLNVTGGLRPLTCGVSAGALPDGVEVEATETGCKLAGMPTTQQGAGAVTFTVADAGGTAAATTSTVNITVNGTAPTAEDLGMDGDPFVGATLTARYVYLDADGDEEGTGTGVADTSVDWCRTGDNKCNLAGNFKSRTYVAQASDAGKKIYFKLVPRSITGTPSTQFTFTSPETATIVSALTAVANSTPQVLTVGQANYGFNPFTSVTGGSNAYTYEVVGGALPAGLELNADTGIVSGTPTTARVAGDVTFQVKDRTHDVVAANTSKVSFAVSSAITATAITTARTITVDTATGGADVMSVSGGTKPYTCEHSGTLPVGLVVAPNDTATHCRVTGTPTVQQLATAVTFRVKDANGVYATATSTVNFTIQGAAPVASALKITGDLTVGSTVTGSYTYTDANNDLEGDSLIEWCRWGVEPCTQVGNRGTGDPFRYTLQDGDVGDKGFHFRVTPRSASGNPVQGTRVLTARNDHIVTRTTATAVTTAQVLEVGRAATNFSPLTQGTGGKLPYTYELQAGSSLPAGMNLNASTGVVSGTPTTQRTLTAVVFRVKDANGVYATTTSSVNYTVNGRAPVASSLSISGTSTEGQTLTANYSYSDPDNDPEGGTIFNWCWRGQDCGKGSSKTYTLKATDVGKEMSVEITPKSSTGSPDIGTKVVAHAGAIVASAIQPMSATRNTTPQWVAIGQPFSFVPFTSVTGGVPPYTYERASGAIVNMQLVLNGNMLSGTPNTIAPPRLVVFRVKDSRGAYAPNDVGVSISNVYRWNGPRALASGNNNNLWNWRITSYLATEGGTSTLPPTASLVFGGITVSSGSTQGRGWSTLEIHIKRPGGNWVKLKDVTCTASSATCNDTTSTGTVSLAPVAGYSGLGDWELSIWSKGGGSGATSYTNIGWFELRP